MIYWSYCKIHPALNISRVSLTQGRLLLVMSVITLLNMLSMYITLIHELPFFFNQLWVYIGLWYHVVWQNFTSVAQEPAASIIYPHDVGSRFFWKVCRLLWDYWVSHPSTRCLHGLCWKNLKSHLHKPFHNFCFCVLVSLSERIATNADASSGLKCISIMFHNGHSVRDIDF